MICVLRGTIGSKDEHMTVLEDRTIIACLRPFHSSAVIGHDHAVRSDVRPYLINEHQVIAALPFQVPSDIAVMLITNPLFQAYLYEVFPMPGYEVDMEKMIVTWKDRGR